ncbi:hypothetical protein BFJ66_g17076 [Fusarium oxysporum f. sp. cepae]|uniref:DUF7732 domain-containing protein n=1 Tax=Fusarium oxysporum f. sp. cepae TaxID=396571 RepID=A0A3L6N033_FUSOX|nr:hypothetical protein BFJ65_g14613 [Fusarium oxysporum f. sp. cepae]RKK21214.1 hypothetical protein BFJ67_g17399 [Fusarium oxysporum f. sp. cepae]RKK26531.1 hypothetical protein BFJ66_g17076 [Fusarium oxysporum f. sp. cepae]
MRLCSAIILFTLIPYAFMSTIIDSLNPKRIGSEPRAETHPLDKRRGSSHGGRRGGTKGSGSESSHGSPGVGPQPTFADGRYYAGGSVRPFKAGAASPGGIRPYPMAGAALSFWPGVWLYGAYMYPFTGTCSYHNETSDEDEERPVLCGCSRYENCACDDPDSAPYFKELIGSGSYEALNKSIVDVAVVNGTKSILINGTLPNDTALASDKDKNSAPARCVVGTFGYWPAVAVVVGAAFIS